MKIILVLAINIQVFIKPKIFLFLLIKIIKKKIINKKNKK